MKRVLVGALLALFFAVPMSASADSPYVDKVDGTVEDLFPSTLHVNAISEADGTDARGQLWYTADNPGFPFVVDVAGEVTCLNVQGSNASIGMKIDRSKLPGFPGEGNGFLFIVHDDGEPGDMDTHLDIPLTNPPTTCLNPVPFPFAHDHGNFVVQDAT
jgi:hypothetical protein